jgi:nucleoid-associated protein YgaU
VEIDVQTQTATVAQDTARIDNTVIPKTYTVEAGDCLWNISKRFLGAGERQMEIYMLNAGILETPDLIHPGQVLKLPS